MLIHSASQLLTLSGGVQRGAELGTLNMLTEAAVLVREGLIVETGSSEALLHTYPDEPRLDARGRVVMPGFVDPHTHAVWVGNRAAEFEMRLSGKSYLEILAAGGGILSTVKAVRQASILEMAAETLPRLTNMLLHGTTTAEIKTGYGLDLDAELKQLEAIYRLDDDHPIELAATFMGAHAIPPEYEKRPGDYTNLVVEQMLPAVKTWCREHAPHAPLPFCDVFCEKGAFDLVQSCQVLSAAKELGFRLKIHADEFENLGGAALAASLGAVSADHLVKTSLDDIQRLAASDTVAVGLPCTPFGLAEADYTPARRILEAGGILALASDINPGTAWCESMQFVIALACRYMKLTPAQAIAAATINAAAALSMQDRIGSIEPGKQADLIILAVDDYRHLGYRFGVNLVETVIKKGRRVVFDQMGEEEI